MWDEFVTRGDSDPVYTDPVYTGEELLKPCVLKQLKYLVVGTGRCGSVYTAKLLSSVGIPCTHEAIFKHDGLDACLERMKENTALEVSFISRLASMIDEMYDYGKWFKDDDGQKIVAESSYMAAPYLDHPALDDVTIIHIIRHPMKVINSFVSGFEYFNDWCLKTENFEEYHKFIYKYIPELYNDMSPVMRCALYWIRWNQMIEEKAKGRRYFLFRVEQNPSKLFNFLGIRPPIGYYNNNKVNEKAGLAEVYDNFNQIPSGEIRNELIATYNHYYGLCKLFI